MDIANKIALAGELHRLADAMQQAEAGCSALIEKVHPSNRRSAANLIHYLVLRNTDIRALQNQLHHAGLSSLSNSESHIRHQLLAVLRWLEPGLTADQSGSVDAAEARSLILTRSNRLFGSYPAISEPILEHMPFIMVTLDASLAGDEDAICRFLHEGMNVARINCAHDDETTWSRLIATLRAASKKTGKGCRVYMDLAGPKLRTGIPGKGRDKRKLPLRKGQKISLVEPEYKAGDKEKAVSCSVRGVIAQLHPGQHVLFDDGLVSTVVKRVNGNTATLLVERVSEKKPWVKAGKGINFPNARLKIVSLTREDSRALPFICREADIIGYSFVRFGHDLDDLQQSMTDLCDTPPPVVVKIETPEAFSNLPALLLQGMTQPVAGVMIARGDLAVEVGFERMSELQEEILWLCEAAHVPVIWATQVLETLQKTGVATRSEATDAARASLAECVMINKGPYTVEVIRMLKDILRRSGGHHFKRRRIFRPLAVATTFFHSGKELFRV